MKSLMTPIALMTIVANVSSLARADHAPAERADRLALKLEQQAEDASRFLQTNRLHDPHYDRLVRAGDAVAENAADLRELVQRGHVALGNGRRIRRDLQHTEELLSEMRRTVKVMRREIAIREHHSGPAARGRQPASIGFSLGHGFEIFLTSEGRIRRNPPRRLSPSQTLDRLDARLLAMQSTLDRLAAVSGHGPLPR